VCNNYILHILLFNYCDDLNPDPNCYINSCAGLPGHFLCSLCDCAIFDHVKFNLFARLVLKKRLYLFFGGLSRRRERKKNKTEGRES